MHHIQRNWHEFCSDIIKIKYKKFSTFLLFFASFQILNAQNECKDELILKDF